MYTVIEYTSGYMPEDDDPPVFDQWNEALQYVNDRRQELFDDDSSYSYPPDEMDDGNTRHLMMAIGEVEDGCFVFYDNRQTYPLARIVEIVLYEEELDGTATG